jgi:plasmid stabilization system protein ParE
MVDAALPSARAIYDEAPMQDCRLLAEGQGARDLRFARAGGHFVVFTRIGREVVILDFIHARADLPRRLEALRQRLG